MVKNTIYIVGDLNCNLLDTEKNVHSRQLTDIMDIYQLEQIITEPTRITTDTASLIDVFITNSAQTVKSSGVIRLGISDHYMIYACTKDAINRSPLKIVESRSFKNYNKFAFIRGSVRYTKFDEHRKIARSKQNVGNLEECVLH